MASRAEYIYKVFESFSVDLTHWTSHKVFGKVMQRTKSQELITLTIMLVFLEGFSKFTRHSANHFFFFFMSAHICVSKNNHNEISIMLNAQVLLIIE